MNNPNNNVNQVINTLTNRIIVNRLIRGSRKILTNVVFDMNDNYTRNRLRTELNLFLKKTKPAIREYELEILPFDITKPHVITVKIIIYLNNLIEHVYVYITNED